MKRTCLQKNTYTDEQSRCISGSCEFHPVEILFKEQHFDPKDIQHLKSFVRMKKSLVLLSIIVSLLIGLTACNKNEDSDKQLLENEFIVEPSAPTITQDINVITFDCKYNQFGYIKKVGYNIEVVKHFNSMMKLSCVLDYDTIPLGKLAAGTYQLTFTIVDRPSPKTALNNDSIFSTQTRQLVVKN